MQDTKKQESWVENRTEKYLNGRNKITNPSNLQERKNEVLTTVMPCYESNRNDTPDSLESLLDGYLQQEQSIRTKDSHHNTPINYEMIEDTLLETLNLTRNPNSLKRMSHTVLQYFVYVVFNQIKNNYYKQMANEENRYSGRQNESTFFFERKNACSYALFCALKKLEREANKNMQLDSNSKTKLQSANAFISNHKSDIPKQEEEIISNTPTSSDTSQETASSDISENATEDAFLCNIPNAPPFILKMNKVTPASVLSEYNPEKTEIFSTSPSLTSSDETLDVEDFTSTSMVLGNKSSFHTEVVNLNMYIDNNCPGFEDKEFRKFVAKSITWIKSEGVKRMRRPRGLFMSTPTICMAGITGISNNPFGVDEIDSRRPGKNNGSFLNADVLYKKNSFHVHSKIPRMLHPGKCKVHSKMKNVQLSPGSKGCAANKANACTGPCPTDKMEVQINPYVKVSVSTTCPSLTDTNPSSNVKAGGTQGNKNKNPNIQASQPSMGDCMKGIKSDPGCYCGNEPVESTTCPIRLREDFEFEDEAAAQTAAPEEEDPLCYCPPGEQPLLMKKSNIECDCANRLRCEDETLVEPPKEKPDVFWALTKVSLLKDGTKNFEIIDVSPVPPGYYLMPDVNNLVLVGPQPKPAKAIPSKNCSCK